MNGFQGISVCAMGRSIHARGAATLNPLLPFCICRMALDEQDNLVVRTIEGQCDNRHDAEGIAEMYNRGNEDSYFQVIKAVGADKAMLDAVWARQQ